MSDSPTSGDYAWAETNKVGAELQRLESRVTALERNHLANSVSVDGQDLMSLINAIKRNPPADARSDILVVCDRLQAAIWHAKG